MNIPWNKLAEKAWKVRENSFLYSKTKVGAAALSESGNIYVGCNVQQIYRSHDIHAEVNAIGNMISHGDHNLIAILIVAERKFFTPCGSCMDWIMQFGGENCVVGVQNVQNSEVKEYFAKELMPYYPK